MSSPRPTATNARKVPLLDQLLFVEDEINDVDIWESVYHSEGEELPKGMAYRRAMCRALARTIELLKAHETDFVKLIQAKRARQR